MIRLILAVLFLALASNVGAIGQTFSSGSTGADGALDLTDGDIIVQLPESGVLNCTTVNIPAGRTLRFKPNSLNTPVVMLASGNVSVAGTIDVSQQAGCFVSVPQDYSSYCGRVSTDPVIVRPSGPGGFYGGAVDQAGFGPAGGEPGEPGLWIGSLSLVPMIGGSGGGGNIPTGGTCGLVAGGGGGGAILIASSQQIDISGGIIANGGGGFDYNGSCVFTAYGGAGGSIRLIANSVNINGTLTAMGGTQSSWTANAKGAEGTIRIESPFDFRVFTGSANPPAVLSEINPMISPTAVPSIKITSIGGFPVPSISGQTFDTIDVLLPKQLSDPIPIVVEATNIPPGSPVSVKFSGSVEATSTTANLAGTTASSSATAYVSGVDRGGVTYLFVSAQFDVSLIAGSGKDGPDAIDIIEAVAGLGEKTKYRFLKRDGSEISLANVSATLRQKLGL